MKPIEFISLGQKSYLSTLEFQYELRRKLQEGQGRETVLTVEHEKVITQGRRPAEEDFLISPETLKGRGFSIQQVNRGGKLTYHGPGQLVAYFIIDLKKRRLSIPQFVSLVEETAVQTLRELGVEGHRRQGCPGVWVGPKKITSIGLSVDRGVSMHGLALNVAPDLKDFEVIVPCGIPHCPVTSVLAEGRKPVTVGEVEPIFQKVTRQVFSAF